MVPGAKFRKGFYSYPGKVNVNIEITDCKFLLKYLKFSIFKEAIF